MRSLKAATPDPAEIGSLGYFRLLQHHYWEFLKTYDTVQNENYKRILEAGEPWLMNDCAAALHEIVRYIQSLGDSNKGDLAFSTYVETLKDAHQRVGIFENRILRLLHGSETDWLRNVYPDQHGITILEEAIKSMDSHLENNDPRKMAEALRLHNRYRDYLRGIHQVYGAQKKTRYPGSNVETSLSLLDEEADDIFILAFTSGEEWVR